MTLTGVPSRTLDRTSSLPLWAQISTDLRRRCDQGEFADAVPGELALSREYEVSRHTIREALRHLRAEGVISSARGRMSTVGPGFSQRLGAVYSLFRSVEQQGAEQTSDLLRREITTDPLIAARLGLPDDTPLLLVERLRRADGQPLAHDISWMTHALAHPLLDTDFSRTALYDELEAIGVSIDAGRERMQAIGADQVLGGLLDCPVGSPLLAIDRLALAAGEPVEWRRTHVRGDRFTLESTWSSGATRLTLTEN